MTDAEAEALLARADVFIEGCALGDAAANRSGESYVASLVRQLATALRHSREELRAAREDEERLTLAWKDGANSAADAGGIGIRSFEAWCALMYQRMKAYFDAARAARGASEEKP